MSDKPIFNLSDFIGKQVVLDTDSSYIYVGTLESIGSDYYALSNVDVHDTTDSKSTKEQYAHESKKLGDRANRKLTYVRVQRVISISKLDDIISF